MIVEQIWTGNAYRNFNYLIVCPESGETLAVDPLDHKKCLARAKEHGWEITQILNTHEHGDHTGGNRAMIAATGAKLLAHVNASDKIPGMDRGLAAGDIVKVGKTVELESLDTPGHTMSHVCLLSHTETPALLRQVSEPWRLGPTGGLRRMRPFIQRRAFALLLCLRHCRLPHDVILEIFARCTLGECPGRRGT